MTIENFCEYVRKIHADPMIKVTDLSIKDFYALRDHIKICDACAALVNEVVEKYKDVPDDTNLNDGRWN